MRISKLTKALGLFTVLILAGCGQHRQDSLYVVVLADVSASIYPDSADAMIDAIESMIGQLERGETLVVIPITNDADVNLSGHVLRLENPTKREPYDYDLTRFRADARQKLLKFRAEAMNQPGVRTDLLGALRAAAQELRAIPRGDRGVMVILSDFIQDDRQFDFKMDANLSRPATATALALRLSGHRAQSFNGTPTYLGHLRSHDLSNLSRDRREAIQDFWIEYLKQLGARPQCAIDGTGLLPRFLVEVQTAGTRR